MGPFTDAERSALGPDVARTLAALHAIDWRARGMDFLGHAEFARISATKVLEGQGIGCGPQSQPDGDLRLLPHVHGTDGFYAAVLERKK